MLGLPPRQPTRDSRHSLEQSAQWAKLIFRFPVVVLLDVSHERPLFRSLALLGLLYTANSLSVLAIGDRGMLSLPSDSLGGTLAAIAIALAVLTAMFLATVTATHLVARTLDGGGSLQGMICVAAYSLLPFAPFALVTLLLALPFWGTATAFLQFVALLVGLVWSASLYFLAIRENNAFTGVQAMLAMFLPPGILAIGSGLIVIVVYFVIILAS